MTNNDVHSSFLQFQSENDSIPEDITVTFVCLKHKACAYTWGSQMLIKNCSCCTANEGKDNDPSDAHSVVRGVATSIKGHRSGLQLVSNEYDSSQEEWSLGGLMLHLCP